MPDQYQHHDETLKPSGEKLQMLGGGTGGKDLAELPPLDAALADDAIVVEKTPPPCDVNARTAVFLVNGFKGLNQLLQ
jgi:hypothetical protein